MIELSIQPGTETAKSPQTAASGIVPDGLFAALLEGRMTTEGSTPGKTLPDTSPDTGKDLPLDLAIAGKGEISAKGKGLEALTSLAGLPVADTQAEDEDTDSEPAADLTEAADGIGSAAKAQIANAEASIPAIVAIIPQMANTPAAAATEGQALQGSSGTPVPLPANPLPASLPEVNEEEQQRPTHAPLPKLAPAANADPVRLHAEKSALATEVPVEAAKTPEGTETTREQASARSPATRQIRIDLAQETRPESAKAATEVRTNERTIQVSALSQAATVALGDGAAPSNGQSIPRVSLHAPAAIQPHDFSALVDRLVEAREAARPQTVNLSVVNSDFGEVSLRFNHDDRGLTVSMTSNDPEFNRAVSNAMPADRTGSGEGMAQNGRRDDGAQHAFSRGAGDSSSTGNNGAEGRERRDTQRAFVSPRENPSHQAGSGTARNGIFA